MISKVTFDYNCLIDLSEGREAAKWLDEIVALHEEGSIKIMVPEIAASENPREGDGIRPYDNFVQMLKKIGLESAIRLSPLAYINLTFIDHCLIAGKETLELERQIHEILFPKWPYDSKSFKEEAKGRGVRFPRRLWRNHKCDVLCMWCHIRNDGDIFVSRDGNFFEEEKKKRLEHLGAGRIVSPQEACQFLRA